MRRKNNGQNIKTIKHQFHRTSQNGNVIKCTSATKQKHCKIQHHKTLGQDIKFNLEQKVGKSLGIFLTFFLTNQKVIPKQCSNLTVVCEGTHGLHCPPKPLAFTRNTTRTRSGLTFVNASVAQLVERLGYHSPFCQSIVSLFWS